MGLRIPLWLVLVMALVVVVLLVVGGAAAASGVPAETLGASHG